MNIAIVAFTKKGGELNQKLCYMLEAKQHRVRGYSVEKYAVGTQLTPFKHLGELIGLLFAQVDGLIFIGACGIAVRAIAPYIKSKETDPAVVVVDERAQFAISLLSGHIGGANTLTKIVAQAIGATPVITTATDSYNQFAVDSWAVENHLTIEEISSIKNISGAILNGEKVGFYSDIAIQGTLPQPLTYENQALGICVSKDINKKPFKQTLHLIPKNIVLGIGCKRGTAFEQVEAFVESMLAQYNIAVKSIVKICSIDLKANEQAIIQLAKKYNVDFVTYTAQQLRDVQGEFTASVFVKNTVGVDNVCERSAVLGSCYGCRVISKIKSDGMTLAACEIEHKLKF